MRACLGLIPRHFFDMVIRCFVPALVILCVGSVAVASECPAAPDHSGPISELLEDVQSAANEQEAQSINTQLWEYWADAPDERAQEILDSGMSRREVYDFVGALADFDRLVDYCPNYAEGYNQRAFVHYLRRDFAAALRDLDRALALSPRHVGAMSGRALSLLGLSRIAEAREALRAALDLNPWLSERHLLAPGAPLADESIDL
jgi:tetratricopeptide (TPR) repeat protein